eukprot:COSAG04_NODE_1471_length_6586_cov_1.959149_9_plen_79_part_01
MHLLWHLSQPLAYLFIIDLFKCELSPSQRLLATIVAMRECWYLGFTILALFCCPAFLLVDLPTIWKEAKGKPQRIRRLA